MSLLTDLRTVLEFGGFTVVNSINKLPKSFPLVAVSFNGVARDGHPVWEILLISKLLTSDDPYETIEAEVLEIINQAETINNAIFVNAIGHLFKYGDTKSQTQYSSALVYIQDSDVL